MGGVAVTPTADYGAPSARLFAIGDVLDTDHWYTPPWIFDGLGITFDLDVSAPVEPLAWIPARQSYTIDEDGLSLPWHGTVWCNPPYSAPLAWCYRWAKHGNGCILLRSDMSTRGPYAATQAATSLYVSPRRIEYVNGHGTALPNVNFSSILLGAGPIADEGIARLAAVAGGTARRLVAEGVSPNDGSAP
jgi:hypothetical protein